MDRDCQFFERGKNHRHSEIRLEALSASQDRDRAKECVNEDGNENGYTKEE